MAQDITAALQQALDTWEGSIRATGGALDPGKSFWYMIDFIWDGKGNWRYAKGAELPYGLQMYDREHNIQVLERLEVDKAHTTLGVDTAPDGNMYQQVGKMRSLAEKWADQIWTGRLSQADAWVALWSMIMKTLEYPLLATTLTKQQCRHIMAPIRNTALPAMGINKNLAHDIMYGSIKAQGLGIPWLYTMQGIIHIVDLITQATNDMLTGQLYRFSLEELVLDAGIGKCSFLGRLHSL
jgi:hypothetical protein